MVSGVLDKFNFEVLDGKQISQCHRNMMGSEGPENHQWQRCVFTPRIVENQTCNLPEMALFLSDLFYLFTKLLFRCEPLVAEGGTAGGHRCSASGARR